VRGEKGTGEKSGWVVWVWCEVSLGGYTRSAEAMAMVSLNELAGTSGRVGAGDLICTSNGAVVGGSRGWRWRCVRSMVVLLGGRGLIKAV
jgi:hypothetical protein